LEDYIHAADHLSISSKQELQGQVEKIVERSRYNEFDIKNRLLEKDEQIQKLREGLSSMETQMEWVLESLRKYLKHDDDSGYPFMQASG